MSALSAPAYPPIRPVTGHHLEAIRPVRRHPLFGNLSQRLGQSLSVCCGPDYSHCQRQPSHLGEAFCPFSLLCPVCQTRSTPIDLRPGCTTKHSMEQCSVLYHFQRRVHQRNSHRRLCPASTSISDKRVFLNGFDLDVGDMKAVARQPSPGVEDLHVQDTSGVITLLWNPPTNGAASYNVHVSTNGGTLNQVATKQSGRTYTLSGMLFFCESSIVCTLSDPPFS